MTPEQREIGAKAADVWPAGYGYVPALVNTENAWEACEEAVDMEVPGALL